MTFAQVSTTVQHLQPSLIRKVANSAFGRTDVIPLWFGEPNVVTPGFIREAAKTALDDGKTFYQQGIGVPALRQSIVTYMNDLYGATFEPDNVVVTASGTSAVSVVCQCLITHGDKVVVVTPVWPNLWSDPLILGAQVTTVALHPQADQWKLDLDELFDACGTNTKVLFINSPNNPTGWMISDAEQQAILAFCRERGIWLVADEVYNRIVYDTRYAPTFANKMADEDNCIIINSFSKSWAMTGWRLGWITAPKRMKPVLEMMVEFNWSCVFAPTQIAGIAALEEGEAFIDMMRGRYQASLEIIAHKFSEFPRIIFPKPKAAFYAFFSLDGLEDSFAFAMNAIDKTGVGLAPGAAFGAEGFLRICCAVDNTVLEMALDKLSPLLR
jgi:aspartate/methionine/tyrosine aminotransferase